LIEKIGTNPADIEKLILCPEGVAQSVWMYEHLR